MSSSISKKESNHQESLNLVNLLEGKRFNVILMTVVSISAVLVILWG